MGNYLNSNNALMFHLVSLTVSWNILASISVYMALYKHKIFGYYAHAIISWLVIILTLVCTLLYIVPKGIPQQCSISGEINCDFYQFPLAIEGTVLVIWIAVQIFSGIFCRAWQENPLAKSLSVIRSRRFHQYSGWFILLLGKFNCLTHWRDVVYIWVPLLIWEIVFIIAYIRAKYFFKTLEMTVLDPQIYQKNTQYPKIKSIQQLGKDKGEYVIFADHVYQTWALRTLHPAGYQIIDAIKGRQIDRFIYGMYGAERLPEIGAYSHPAKSMELVGKPIAKIQISSPYSNMLELNNCQISYNETVSVKNKIYIVGLTSLVDQKSFRFNGYSELAQVGQYFSLTIDGKTTRLYTTVNCLTPSNRNVMSSISALMKGSHRSSVKNGLKRMREQVKQTKKAPQIILKSDSEARLYRDAVGISIETLSEGTVSHETQRNIPDAMVPLMIKKYEKGKLTPVLLSEEKDPENLCISSPRGQGLKLQYLPPGNVVFVAGGTGFYPFMDLIDLLFKEAYLKNKFQRQSIKIKVRSLNPILKSELLPNLTFSIYVAVNGTQDLHPISLFQLNYLCQQEPTRFNCVFKIKEGREDFEQLYPSIQLTSERFDKLVIPEAKKETTRKVYICGPPAMNTSMSLGLLENEVSEDLLELV